ncbi:hypothetical protein SAMN05880501_113110 [Ureibacillus xyleni]|uniref:Uncharacterized protein n=1 Tax=Ureibacillus xyleni TaxID=614648 RepID=A0A285TIU5_9BACL|nr:hypothetical protein [Ureibacillus xyleni]SOC22017.1 hypothetical protein SAMN05880501_113110 [Ureibacillus xyleni]
MTKVNTILAKETSFVAMSYVPQLNMVHVEVLPEESAMNKVAKGMPLYKVFAELIQADTIDIIDLTDDLCVIVDDEGLLKSGNLVYELELQGTKVQIAGRFAFGRNYFCENHGLKTIPLTPFDYVILKDLDVEIIGQVR